MRERFTIAAVQPDSVWGQEEWRNAEVAYRAVEEAAARGAELDMARLAWLRTHYHEPLLFEPPEDDDEPEFSCRPGQIHERRPELYRRLVEPQPSAFDYFYYRRAKEAWREEFDKAHRFETERYGPYADRQVLGARLRAERERRKLSLSELARRLGVTASLISQIETGKSKPSVVTLYGIASKLGLSVDDLLFSGNGAHAPQAAPGGSPRARPAGADAGVGAGAGAGAGEAAPAPPAVPQGEPGPVLRADRRKVIELESGVRWERLTAAKDPDVDFLTKTPAMGRSIS
jgi:transcriptional regulator with XRE-family HTH domain